MKKSYVKPEIVFESFVMSTSIAGTCESIVGNPSKESCAVLGSGGIAMFDGTVPGCVFKPEDMGQKEDTYDGYCYHVPSDLKNFFNS